MRRFLKRATWITAIPAALAAAALVWGLANPSWLCRGNASVGLVRGQLEVAWSSGTVIREPQAWVIKNPQGYASILLGPRSGWRPTTMTASMGMGAGPGGAALFKVTALFVPLWPILVLFGGATGFLWWRARRIAIPGHCRQCGYSLEGLASEKCPECGNLIRRLFLRFVRSLRTARVLIPAGAPR